MKLYRVSVKFIGFGLKSEKDKKRCIYIIRSSEIEVKKTMTNHLKNDYKITKIICLADDIGGNIFIKQRNGD